MKKSSKTLFTLAVACLLTLVGCNQQNGKNPDVGGGGVPDTPIDVPATEYSVIFEFADGSTREVTVKENETVTNIGEDGTVSENERWDGWYLNGEPYDFSTPVTGNIILTSHTTKFEDIKIKVSYYEDSAVDALDRNAKNHVNKADKSFIGYYGLEYEVKGVLTNSKSVTYDGDYEIHDALTDELIQTVMVGDKITLTKDIYISRPGTIKKFTINFVDCLDYLPQSVTVEAGNDYMIPDVTIPSTETSRFMGFMVDDSIYTEHPYRIYRPGETITKDEIKAYGTITLTPYFVDISEAVEVSTFEDLLAVDSYATVILTDDIDANNEDVGTGIGDGEFNGIILGDGHTIRNYTVNHNDEYSDGAGLIDHTSEGCEIYDLTVENVDILLLSAIGGAALIGTSDYYCILKNVHAKNITFSDNDYSKWGFASDGIGGLVGQLGAGYIDHCSVENINTSHKVTGNPNKGSSPRLSLGVGGIIGKSVYTNDGGLRISNCTTNNSTIVLDKYMSGELGGIIGYVDGTYSDSGVELIGNTVNNTKVAFIDALPLPTTGLSGRCYVGGIVGDLNLYSSTVYNSNGDIVPNFITRNKVVGGDVSYNDGENHTNISVSVGGFAGNIYSAFGSRDNDAFVAVKENMVDNTTVVNSKVTSDSFVRTAGFVADFDFETRNCILTDISSEASVTSIVDETIGTGSGNYKTAQAFGYGGFESNTKYSLFEDIYCGGVVTALEPTENSGEMKGSAVAGLAAVVLNADGLFETSSIYVDTTFTNKDYGAIYFEASMNAYGDSETAGYYLGDLYVNDITNRGYCHNLYNSADPTLTDKTENYMGVKEAKFSNESEFITTCNFNSSMWTLKDNKPFLKVFVEEE